MRWDSIRFVATALIALGLGACAGMSTRDAPQVTVAGVESIPGEGLELRMMLSLRVQNPNDAPIDYDGVYVKLEVQDKTFATGVSDARGTIPRFGEAVIPVPVTVSMMSVVRQVLAAADSKSPVPEKIRFALEGKLDGTGFGAVRFRSHGELQLPSTPPAPDSAPR